LVGTKFQGSKKTRGFGWVEAMPHEEGPGGKRGRAMEKKNVVR